MRNKFWWNKDIALFLMMVIVAVTAKKAFMSKPVKSKPTKQEKPLVVEIEVREGYCLSKIAQDLGTNWQEIAQINQLKNPHLIYPGQKLKVIPFSRNNIMRVSWCGEECQGNPMANGKPFNMYDPTITAQKWLPIGKKVRLRCIETQKTIVVTVLHRGPYYKDRCFDLSWAAAELLEIVDIGVATCEVTILPD